MDGLAAVQLHINDLRSRFEARPATAKAASTAGSTAAGSTVGSNSAASFADVLASVAGATTSGGSLNSTAADASAALTPASRLPAGQYGALQPPAELAAYGNGQIPSSALKSIGVGDHQLYAPAANSFARMRNDATAAGVTIGVNDSYRSMADQQHLASQLGLYSQGGKAAVPGTSTHGWGLSLDLQLDGRAQQWMRDNGYKYGYVEDVPREPWHWTYRPG